MVDAIIFDFDGVIVDSISLKTEAFRTIFRAFPECQVEKFIDFHLENGGLSRFYKIRYFYENLLHEEINEADVIKLAESFSCLVKERLADPAFLIKDTCLFLEQNIGKYFFHIASGAEEEELKFIVRKLRLEKFFRSIHGSPLPKPLIIENILKFFDYSPSKIIMIGDSRNDLEAAQDNGIKFWGYNNPALKKNFNCSYIDNMQGLIF